MYLPVRKVWQSKWKLWRWLGSCRQQKSFIFAAILLIGHSRGAPSLCFKARLSCEAIDRKWFFILMQITLFFINKGFALTLVFLELQKIYKSLYVILCPAIGRTFLEENLRVLKTKKKVLQDSHEFKFRIHILYILKKTCHIHFKQHQRLES